MKTVLFFTLLLAICSMQAKADSFEKFKGCGEYQVAGSFCFNKEKKRFEFLVFKGSQSEIKILLNKADEMKAAFHLKRSSLVHATFRKQVKDQRGEFEIISIKERIANPLLGAKDSGFRLIKEEKCTL